MEVTFQRQLGPWMMPFPEWQSRWAVRGQKEKKRNREESCTFRSHSNCTGAPGGSWGTWKVAHHPRDRDRERVSTKEMYQSLWFIVTIESYSDGCTDCLPESKCCVSADVDWGTACTPKNSGQHLSASISTERLQTIIHICAVHCRRETVVTG